MDAMYLEKVNTEENRWN